MKTIYKKLLFLLMLLPFVAMAQNGVSGTVVDAKSKQPLPGVNVVVQGSSKGTATDFDGKFSISNLKSGDKIVFSFIGYENSVVSYTDQKTISVSLKEDANELKEVVVQVGYGSVKKKDATGAVDLLTSKDFNRGANFSAESLLTGRVAGVTVTSGGAPGSGAAIRIRGGASLEGIGTKNDPLIVLDGLILDNSVDGANGILSAINPADIETYSILKDASACAIYGNRGSNGVILITTKKGGKGGLKVSANTTFTVNTLAKRADVTSAQDFRGFITNPANISQYSIAPSRVSSLGNSNTDWQGEIFSNSVTLDNNFSFRGELFKAIPANFSYGHTYIPGILKTSTFDRTTTALRLNPSLFNNHLKIAINGNFNVEKNRRADEGIIRSAITFDPTQSVYMANPIYGGYFQWMDNPTTINQLASKNPVASLMQRYDRQKTYRYFGNIQMDYKFHFLPDLKIVGNYGIDNQEGRGTDEWNYQSPAGRQSNITKGTHSEFYAKRQSYIFDAYLNYAKAFGKLNLDATVGQTYQVKDYYKFVSGNIYAAVNNDAEPYTDYTRKLYSYFGRSVLNYDNKYLLTLNVRKDISNLFVKEKNSGIFPGAAFAWNITNEDFLKNNKLFNSLKLRLGWGKTGMQEINASFNYIESLTLGNAAAQYQFGNTLYTTAKPNIYLQDLTWEKTTTTNVGIDFEMLNNRLKGNLDYYQKETTDLLAYTALADGANLGNYGPKNYGSATGKGIELGLNYDIIKSDNLNWGVNFNANYQARKITATANDNVPGFIGFTYGGINGGVGNTIQINTRDQEPGAFYVYEQVYGTNGKPLEGVYVDRNADGKIDSGDMYHYKKPYADWTFGMMTNLNYKKWDVSMAWRASMGNSIYDNNASSLGYLNSSIAQITPLNNIHPSFNDSGFVNEGNNRYFSDYFIKDASFIKLDNISIGYNINTPFGNNTSMKVNLGCQNVFIFSKYKGLDPEIFSGIDNTIYPRARMFVLGCNVNF